MTATDAVRQAYAEAGERLGCDWCRALCPHLVWREPHGILCLECRQALESAIAEVRERRQIWGETRRKEEARARDAEGDCVCGYDDRTGGESVCVRCTPLRYAEARR